MNDPTPGATTPVIDGPVGAVAQIAVANVDAWRRPGALDGMRAHGVFGAEVEVPVAAPVQERLLGLLGRTA